MSESSAKLSRKSGPELSRDRLRQREIFERDGFVVVPDIIDATLLADLRQHVDAVLDGTLKPDLRPEADDFDIQWEPRVRDNVALARREKVRVVFHMTHSHSWFRDLSRHPAILAAVANLLGPKLKYYTDQMFVKPAQHGSEVPWHHDSAYWPKAAPGLLSLWLAIDDVTIENGCVRFLPGSHRQALEHYQIETDNPNNITVRPDLINPDNEVPVEIRAGSACLHHSLAVHRSLPNTSAHPRRGLVMIYLPADLEFYGEWPFPFGFQDLPIPGA